MFSLGPSLKMSEQGIRCGSPMPHTPLASVHLDRPNIPAFRMNHSQVCINVDQQRWVLRDLHAAAGNSSSTQAVHGSSLVDNDDETRIRTEVTRRIKSLGRQGRVKDAIKELTNMARLGVSPDTLSATALIDCCVRANKMDMAESVFDELFGELLVPDEVAFTVMIRGYGDELPPRWTSIASVLSMMEHTYGIEPTVLTYNTLLEVCSKTNDEDRGIEIIDRMQEAGVEPNEYSLEAVRQRKSLRSLVKKLM